MVSLDRVQNTHENTGSKGRIADFGIGSRVIARGSHQDHSKKTLWVGMKEEPSLNALPDLLSLGDTIQGGADSLDRLHNARENTRSKGRSADFDDDSRGRLAQRSAKQSEAKAERTTRTTSLSEMATCTLTIPEGTIEFSTAHPHPPSSPFLNLLQGQCHPAGREGVRPEMEVGGDSRHGVRLWRDRGKSS